MRYLTTTIALSLLLAGCGGGGGGGGSSYPRETVSGVGLVGTLTHSGSFDVVVNGTNDTVTIGLGQTIRNVSISGTDNDVFIGSSSTVSGSCTLSGVNATLHLPPGSLISVSITGVGCTTLYDAVGG